MLAPLLAVLALLVLTATASAAFNQAAQNPRYGEFLLQQSEASAFESLQLADPIKGNGEWIYDDALGVPVYVRQNPWTKFDPLGLQEAYYGPGYIGYSVNSANPGTAEQKQKWGKVAAATAVAVVALPVVVAKAPAVATAAIANPIVAGDAAVTIAETATGMEGPGVPNAGDMVRLPAQAAMRNSEEIVVVGMDTARKIKSAMEEVVEKIYRGVPGNSTEKARLGQQGVAIPRGTATDPASLRKHVLGEDVDSGVVSFTPDREVARRFSGGDGTIIEVPRSKVQDRIIPRPDVGKYGDEAEVLIQGTVQGKPTKP